MLPNLLKLYAYTDEDRYEGRIARGLKPLLKVGGAEKQTVDERIKQQDGTSQPVPLRKVLDMSVPFWDTDFHTKWLIPRGYEKSRNEREWFYITLEELIKEIEAYSAHLSAPSFEVKKEYTPRTYQTIVAEEVVSRWNGSSIIVPNLACPRFGKDLLHLHIFYLLFQKYEFRTAVIAGYCLGANESLIGEIQKLYNISADIAVIKPCDWAGYVKGIESGQRVVIDVSLHKDSLDPRIAKELEKENTLVIVDEADYGAWTSNSKKVLETITNCGNNLILLSTGTFIERALVNAGEITEPISVSYLDLLEKKREGDPTYTNFVDVACLDLEFPDEVKNHQKNLPVEKQLTSTKLFDCANSHLHHDVIKQLYASPSGDDVWGLYNASYGSIDGIPAVMQFIYGKMKDVQNFCKQGERFAPNLMWISLTGDDKSTNRKAQDIVEAKLKEAEKEGKDGVVIVSCSQGARSFSIPNIIAVVDCNENGSLATATQRGSRCLTPGLGKKVGLIINYCVDSTRISPYVADMMSNALDKDGDIESCIRRAYRLNKFLKKDEYGYLVERSEKEVFQLISSENNMSIMCISALDEQRLLENNDRLSKVLQKTKSNVNSRFLSPGNKPVNYIPKQEIQKSKGEKRDKWVIKLARQVCLTAGNVFFLAPNASSFSEGLNVIKFDPDKCAEYRKLINNDVNVIIKELLPFLPILQLDIIFQRYKNTHNLKDKNFISLLSSHAPDLFNLSDIPQGSILYGAKEPDPAVLEELKFLSKSHDLTVVACQPGYFEFFDKLGYNTTTEDQLPNGNQMYFNFSLGNPPYSDRSETTCAVVGGSGKSLDDKFTLKCMSISGRVKLIIRAKEFSRANSKFKQQLFSGNHLRSITHVDKSTFPTIQNTVTCVIDWDREYCGETVITYEDGTVVSKLLTKDSVIKLNNPNYVASVDNNMRYRYLRGKIPRHQINDNDGTRIVEIMGKGETPIIRNTLSTPTIGLNEYGVIMNYNSRWEGFDKMSVKESDTCLSESMIMLKTKSDEESLRLIEYLKSDEIVTLMKGLKSGFSNSARIFEMIPDMV